MSQIATLSLEIEDGYKISAEEDQKALEIHLEKEKLRGWLIAETNSIELFLNFIINYSLSGKVGKKSQLFNELILHELFCTIFNKWKIFRGILNSDLYDKEKLSFSEDNLKQLKTEIKEIIDIRNIFAHNRITIQIPELSTFICYPKDGKVKSIELTEEFEKELKDKVEKNYINLQKLFAELKTIGE